MMAAQHIDNIILEREYDHVIKRFNLTARRFVFRFKEFNNDQNPIDWLEVSNSIYFCNNNFLNPLFNNFNFFISLIFDHLYIF